MNDKTNDTQEAPPVKTVEVTLKKNHTHQGEEFRVGDKINVRQNQVAWLKEAGTI